MNLLVVTSTFVVPMVINAFLHHAKHGGVQTANEECLVMITPIMNEVMIIIQFLASWYKGSGSLWYTIPGESYHTVNNEYQHLVH